MKKTRIDLLPMHALHAMGMVMAEGAGKHQYESWRGLPSSEHAEKAHRHLNAWMRGEHRDDDGESHLAHAAVRIMMLLDQEERCAVDNTLGRHMSIPPPLRGYGPSSGVVTALYTLAEGEGSGHAD